MMPSDLRGTRAESFYHKAIKQLVFKFITERNNTVVESSLEKYFGSRRADVYLRLKSGQEVVVEVQHSPMTPREINQRTLYYNKKGIYVLWILHGNGKIAMTPKIPYHEKNVKISTAENRLHGLYGGRVYYVNVSSRGNSFSLTPPYALHFSSCDNISSKIMKENFTPYFFRNANVVRISSCNFLCTELRGYKIARFYDKNAKKVLKDEIMEFIKDITEKSCENCQARFKRVKKCSFNRDCKFKKVKGKKLKKMIINNFKNYYGISMINGIFDGNLS